MPRPVNFPESNFTYTKPEGWSDDECGDLHVYKSPGLAASVWELTPEEIAEVQRTGRITLVVFGDGHPPVYIASGDNVFATLKSLLT